MLPGSARQVVFEILKREAKDTKGIFKLTSRNRKNRRVWYDKIQITNKRQISVNKTKRQQGKLKQPEPHGKTGLG